MKNSKIVLTPDEVGHVMYALGSLLGIVHERQADERYAGLIETNLAVANKIANAPKVEEAEADIAALMTLQGKASVHYVREIAPTWSCARVEELPDGFTVRIRSKRADFDSLAAQKETLEATVGMIFGFAHQARRDAENMEKLILTIGGALPGEITNWIKEDR